jgi:hypothetical protein
MGKTGIGLEIIVLSFFIAAASILVLINLYMQIWVDYLGLPVEYLGYTFIGIIVVVGIGYFYIDSAKMKMNFIAIALFSGIDAVIILFVPNWFHMVFFALVLGLVLQKLDYLH